MPIKILDVGQCGFDGPRMEDLWRKQLGATVERCDFGPEAVQRVRDNKYDIILVNRILAKDGTSGLEVIRDLISTGTKTPVMLVSDRSDAQDEAVALGAVRGFGKAELGQQATLDLVQRVAGG
jgi:DNA-binding response OmpR family regulator